MMRAAYSPIFSESRDFSCALFDRGGRMIAQGRFNPAHLGAIGETVRCVLDELGRRLARAGRRRAPQRPVPRRLPHAGAHAPAPGLPRGRARRLRSRRSATWPRSARSRSARSRRRRPRSTRRACGCRPSRLVRAGEPVDDVWKIILSNHRTPRLTWGDLHAMIGSLELAEQRLQALLDRHGAALALAVSDELLAYGERLMRRRIEAIPDGEYVFEDAMEDDGHDARPGDDARHGRRRRRSRDRRLHGLRPAGARPGQRDVRRDGVGDLQRASSR